MPLDNSYLPLFHDYFLRVEMHGRVRIFSFREFILCERPISLAFLSFQKKICSFSKLFSINPIRAEVLENQDTLGGGVNLTPPLNPMFDVQI